MPQRFVSAKRKALFEYMTHFLVGLALLMKGVDKAEHYREHPCPVVFLFGAGAFIILGAALHQRVARKFPNFTALFHVAEGMALIVVGLALLGKSSRIPYFLFFIGACYLGIGGFELFTDAGARKRMQPTLLTVMGAVFLAAAAVAAVLNSLGSRNAWAYITAGVMAAVGAFMLFLRRRLR